MANTSINLTSLDFNDYKNSLKTYLKSQAAFQDYNFDASNISVILDLLSYNTYLNAFYLNMIGSEMFLDTAVLRDSVVLKAKELNYTPRSFKSAYANVNLVVGNVSTSVSLITIPKGTSFTGKLGSNNYTFSTDNNLIVTGSGGVFYANNVTIKEGTFLTDTFAVQPNVNTDRQNFILSNPTIDTDSLTVTVVEDNGSTVIPYLVSSSILDVVSTSPVFYLQGSDNGKYQIVFGDNIVGRRPADNAVVIAQYRATNGQLPNGIKLFSINGTIAGSSNVKVTTATDSGGVAIPTSGGDVAESIESIRNNAPKFYATQNRAITVNDYTTLLQLTYPEIEAISVYGGEEALPPQYGKVFLSLKIYGLDFIPDSKVTEYTNFLLSRAPVTILPVFVEPEYTYASVSSIVKYNVNVTPATDADIASYATSAIQSYNLANLDDFKATLLYSKLVAAIDVADKSVISNETTYKLMKKLVPTIGSAVNYEINFAMPLNGYFPPQPLNHIPEDVHSILSSKFIYAGQIVTLEDDGNGNIRLIKEVGSLHTTLLNVGTIDYTSGLINLNGLNVDSYYGDSIRIYATALNLDNSTNRNTIFEIPNDEIFITVEAVSQ
jgi:hypothetical protein